MHAIIKRMRKESKNYWSLKSLWKINSLSTIFLITISLILYMKEGVEIIVFPVFLIVMMWTLPFIIIPLVWYFELKPMYDKHYENVKMQKKYKFMLEKFNKTN